MQTTNPTIDEIRAENLRVLIERHGTMDSFAGLVETNANYLSQILSKKGQRKLGKALARRIEEKLGLAKGWMDMNHTWFPPATLGSDELAVQLPTDIVELLDGYLGQPPQRQNLIRKLAQRLCLIRPGEPAGNDALELVALVEALPEGQRQVMYQLASVLATAEASATMNLAGMAALANGTKKKAAASPGPLPDTAIKAAS